jgi:hypothetical protein
MIVIDTCGSATPPMLKALFASKPTSQHRQDKRRGALHDLFESARERRLVALMRRLESTFTGRSRPRSWTPQLDGFRP